ncbi:YdcF family protein [Pontibacter sp. BT731]|uniref:YdcF family protein n=1 Tax=Pontibacter coccineus TaxID=3063328 RepID=UPI0026E317C8|nr:YdcF family protein [Pontibacter sp. BT731]MDO6389076.1 YdcF family protein [Pontibacter sp. BT731]
MIEELIIRALCDTIPDKPVDGLFLFGQTEDNQQAAFETAQNFLQNGRTEKVLCLGTKAMSGYPGFEVWKKEMKKLGIGEEQLIPVPPVPADTEILHTLIEATSAVRYAKEQGFKSLVVTAAPFQQPRAFMTAITAALREYPELYLYSLPGKAMPWQEEVTHSQGKVEDTRAGLIAGEMERIRCYHDQNDLISVQEALDYLNRRDGKLLNG